MEIIITELFNNMAPKDYSASRAEIGQNAAMDTWQAAKDDAPDYNMLDTSEKKTAFIEHMTDMGFSESEEMEEWTDTELTALFIQLIAGDIREDGIDTENPDREEYEKNGNSTGRLFHGVDGEIYYYLGS